MTDRDRAILELYSQLDPTNYRTVRARDLHSLVRWAWKHAEISGGKARELLGLGVMEWRAVSDLWAEQDGIDLAADVIDDVMVPEVDGD